MTVSVIKKLAVSAVVVSLLAGSMVGAQQKPKPTAVKLSAAFRTEILKNVPPMW